MEFSCFCHDEEHEICWDGLIGLFDHECSCCRNTAEQIAELGDPGRVVVPKTKV
jgi:hypothetical protein